MVDSSCASAVKPRHSARAPFLSTDPSDMPRELVHASKSRAAYGPLELRHRRTPRRSRRIAKPPALGIGSSTFTVQQVITSKEVKFDHECPKPRPSITSN